METLFESIRIAIAPDATSEARAVGAHACRAILQTLQPTPPEPPRITPVPVAATAQVAQLVSALRGVPMEQLLDLAITKLRAVVPSPAVPTRSAFSVSLVPVPQ